MMRKQNCWNVLPSPFQPKRWDNDDDYTSLLHDDELTVFENDNDCHFNDDYEDDGDDDDDFDVEVVLPERTVPEEHDLFGPLRIICNLENDTTKEDIDLSLSADQGSLNGEKDCYQSNIYHASTRVSPEVSPCSLKTVKRRRLSMEPEYGILDTHRIQMSYQQVLPMLRSMEQSEITRQRILEQLPTLSFSNRDPSRFYSTQETREILLSMLSNSHGGMTSRRTNDHFGSFFM